MRMFVVACHTYNLMLCMKCIHTAANCWINDEGIAHTYFVGIADSLVDVIESDLQQMKSLHQSTMRLAGSRTQSHADTRSD